MNKELKEGIDYYKDDSGNMVLTKAYHLKRGYCCQSGCLECPYDYHDKIDPSIPRELQNPWPRESLEIYDEDEEV